MTNQRHLKDLQDSWRRSPYPSMKLQSYFPVYVELFSHLVNTECVFIETGVLDGGSLFMWRNWLGPKARVIGVDLNPEALKWCEEGFEILIGDQGDPEFWKSAFKQIGPFDALLDDGGHQSFQQIVTVSEAIRASRKPCIVVVEDTSASFMTEFAAHGKRTFLDYAKASTDILNADFLARYPRESTKAVNRDCMEDWKYLYGVRFYGGIVSFHLDQAFTLPMDIIVNKERRCASDFRFEGKTSAIVKWPDLFSAAKFTRISGGRTRLNALKYWIKRHLPERVLQRLRRFTAVR